MVMSEALLTGLLGGLLGMGLGLLMGQGAVQLVTQTINDLFFVVTVRGVQIPALQPIERRAAWSVCHPAHRCASRLGSSSGTAAYGLISLGIGDQGTPVRSGWLREWDWA